MWTLSSWGWRPNRNSIPLNPTAIELLVAPEPGDAAHCEATLGREVDLVGGSRARFGEPLVRDEHLGVAVLHDVRDLGADEVEVDRHEVPARLEHREVQLEDLDAVGQHHRDRVALLQAEVTEPVHELVA